MNGPEYDIWVISKILVSAFLSAYLVLGAIFYIFCKSMIKNKDGQITIDINSWHSRIAYPFRRYSPYLYYSDNFFSYFTKIFFMFFLGWPFLILWETIKMTVALPILFLVGCYVFSDLEEVTRYENPFYLKVKEFYVPTTTEGFPILPAYILGPIFYMWLAYKWTFTVLITSAVILGLALLLRLLYIVTRSEGMDQIFNYWRQSKIKSSISRMYNSAKKHNCTLHIDRNIK